jgi:hypothetical protein
MLYDDFLSGSSNPLSQCIPGCTPGGQVGFDAFLSSQDIVEGFFNVVVVLNGERVDDFGGGTDADNYVTMFMSSELVPTPSLGLNPVTVTAPFQMGGTLVLDVHRFGGGRSFPMGGKGTATITLAPDAAQRAWVSQEVRYVFESPAAIPEPSTVLLIGAGLAALIRTRARRRA